MSATVLRIIGTSATLTAELQAQAQADLEFPVSFEVLDGVSCQRRGVMAPESYDIYDQWFHSLDLLWTAGSIQPIDFCWVAPHSTNRAGARASSMC